MDDTSLRTAFLGSGSAGNATAVSCGSTLVLIDCGFSAREITRRLTAAGLDASRVSAILVTHEHSDHIRGIEVFCRRHAPECAVLATHGTIRVGGLERAAGDVQRVRPGEVVRIGELQVTAFATSHDASEPVGYRVEGGGTVFGLMTDSGVLTPDAAEALAGVDVLGLESNHDARMLEVGPYPYFLKQRIASDAGHLSNAAAADALESLLSDRLRAVVGLHRSETNNTASLAREMLATRLARLGHGAGVQVASQGGICDVSL